MSAKRPKKPRKAVEKDTSLQFQSERQSEPVPEKKETSEPTSKSAQTPDVPDPATPEPDVPVPDLPDIDTPDTPVPEPTRGVISSSEAQAPLTDREKYLVSIITGQVLNQIDPLLIKLQQISNEAVSMGAQQKVQELEQGIKDRIESRINKINALIGRRGV